jgi:hypothetical protein
MVKSATGMRQQACGYFIGLNIEIFYEESRIFSDSESSNSIADIAAAAGKNQQRSYPVVLLPDYGNSILPQEGSLVATIHRSIRHQTISMFDRRQLLPFAFHFCYFQPVRVRCTVEAGRPYQYCRIPIKFSAIPKPEILPLQRPPSFLIKIRRAEQIDLGRL